MAGWYSINGSIRPNEGEACILDTAWGYAIGYYHEDIAKFVVYRTEYPDISIERFAIINEIQDE